ncbi:MAG: TrmH family RNA methyltransferase [Candidatus Gracilibacteria bacterium]|nr:TrmH family RNA methyltransferase [Candidatus Gracilibacteria bacterium]
MEKIMILDSIRSMQNVGAIFRNADGAGFNKIILCGHTPVLPRGDISKTALGAETFIDWEYYEDIMDVLNLYKEKGFKIFAVELTPKAIDYKKLFGTKLDKTCLVMGNEVLGVSQKVLEFCDEHIIIPMNGKKNSLNVSVAAGIVMYALD